MARYDCVRLKRDVKTQHGTTVAYARLLSIVAGIGQEVVCLAIPFQVARTFVPGNIAQTELARDMDIIEVCETNLIVFESSLLHRIEQIQFAGPDCKYAIVNRFYYSNVFSSSFNEESDSDE